MEHLNSLPSTTPLPPDVPHLIPPTLIYLLSSIPGGLLPESVQEQIEQKGVEDRDAAFGVLEGVKMVSTNTLIGMISVVRLCLGDGMGAQQGGAKIEEEADGREHVVEGGGRKVDKPNRNSSISEGGVNSTFHVAIPSTPESSTKVSRNSADLPPSHSNAENNANLESVLESRDDTANLELEGGALFELGDDEDDDDEGEVKEDAEDEEVVKDEDENEEESDNVPEIEKESKDALDAVKKDAEEEKNDAEEKKKNVKTKDEPTSSFDGASLPITEPKAEPALQPAAELTPSKPRPKTKRAKSLAEEFLGEASLIENDVSGDDNDNSIERTSEKVKIGDVTMDQVEKVDGQTLETPKAPSRLPAGTGGANGATKEEEVCTIDKLGKLHTSCFPFPLSFFSISLSSSGTLADMCNVLMSTKQWMYSALPCLVACTFRPSVRKGEGSLSSFCSKDRNKNGLALFSLSVFVLFFFGYFFFPYLEILNKICVVCE